MNITDACAITGLSRTTLQQRAKSGVIPGAFRTNGTRGHWRFDPQKFDEYWTLVKAGKAPTASPGKKGKPATNMVEAFEDKYKASRQRAAKMQKDQRAAAARA